MSGEQIDFQRLPRNIKPKHYILEFEPDLEALTFTGKARIDVDILCPTKEIKLNSLELEICSANFQHDNGSKYDTECIICDGEYETLAICFCEELGCGFGSLSIDFQGVLNDFMQGFYRSRYIGQDGSDRVSAVTFFEPANARRCFPCWDEPALKATFDIILTIPEDLVGISNMPIISKSIKGDKNVLHFERTPLMSTYLVAMVVGEYDFLEAKTKCGVTIKVYTPLNAKRRGEFALDAAVKVLPFYEDYFGIKYPLAKLDLIAISEFDLGAMENWGLVTFNEDYLLYDPENDPVCTKQIITGFIAHELSHQWFGNLVTMEWWTYLWLNESFALFMEHLCCETVFPEYYTPTQFLADVMMPAFHFDASLKDSHPVEMVIGNPREIEKKFDLISCNKGASILRMIYSYIEDDNFKKGLKLYLMKYGYSCATSDDLWKCLGEVSGKSVVCMMTSWTQNSGFPLIRVSEEQDDQNRIILLTQEKYAACGPGSESSALWIIPISFLISSCTCKIASTSVMDSPVMKVTLPDVKPDDWVLINTNKTAFFRTMYSDEMLDRFKTPIKLLHVPVIDRLSILNDVFSITELGNYPIKQILELMLMFVHEMNYVIWDCINDCMIDLADYVSHTDIVKEFNDYVSEVYSSIKAEITWDAQPDEEIFQSPLRFIVLSRLLTLGDKSVKLEAKKRFNEFLEGKRKMDYNLSAVSYAAVMMDNDQKAMDHLIELYLDKDTPSAEKIRIMTALGKTQDQNLVSQVLKFILNDYVPPQDKLYPLQSLVRTPKGRNQVWSFFKDNRLQLMNKYRDEGTIGELVTLVSSNFACHAKAIAVEQYFRKCPIIGAEKEMEESMQNIKNNVEWLQRNYKDMSDFLKGHHKNNDLCQC